MRKPITAAFVCLASLTSCSQTLLAGHPVRGSVGLYPRGAQGSSNVTFWKNVHVNQEDLGHLPTCFSGGEIRAPGCEDADLNLDLVVDADNLSIFLSCMAGSQQPPSCSG